MIDLELTDISSKLHLGGTIQVWGGICYQGRTDLFICRGKINSIVDRRDIIENVVSEFHGAVRENFRFLDDNATPHRARTVLNRLDELGISTLPLPSRSPDLNPIEHAWDKLQRALERCSPAPRTIQEGWQMSSLVYGMKSPLKN